MDQNYWLGRWKHRQIGFDQADPNPLLTHYYKRLECSKGDTVFVPLTGKTIDVAWLMDQGFMVIGCELSEQAVIELFDLVDIWPEIRSWQHGKLYLSNALTIFVGDFFKLSSTDLGTIDAIYDRAALVALPLDMRKKYTQHLSSITNRSPQLLLVFEYDQKLVPGPPFSISDEEIEEHYSKSYQINILEKRSMPVGIKGVAPSTENAWILTKYHLD